MASDYDSTEFVDGDFQRPSPAYGPASPASSGVRAPSREEVDAKVAEAHARLAELKRAQEDLEREKAALEETRRRQNEFQVGRNEMIQNLTRGLGLLEEAEFTARRDAEQMSKAIADLRDALSKVQAVHEETWTKDTLNVELTQALTTVENARMEWNSARLKFPVLSAPSPISEPPVAGSVAKDELLGDKSFVDLCRYGLALTWPVAAAVIATGALLAILLFSR